MYTMSQKIKACVFVACLTVLPGCDDQKGQSSALPNAVYAEIVSEKLRLTAELPGRVSASMVSEVRPQVSGIVQERFFAEGMDVVAGQVLYQIEPELFQAAHDNAKANLAKAEASEKSARLLSQRYSKIVKMQAVSQQSYDDAIATHQQAQAEVRAMQEAVRTAAINLSYTKVTAPVSGRIGRSYVTPGALVTQNQSAPLATIQNMGSMYVDVSQSSTDLLQLRRALAEGTMQAGGPSSTTVHLKLEDGTPYTKSILQPGVQTGDDWIEGTLLFSDVTINQSTGMVNLRTTFENPHNVLLPGMYVRAVIEEGVLENAITVPQKAVMRDARGNAYVYVLTPDPQNTENAHMVASRPVEIDRNIGNKWLIRSGLSAGDRLLLEGHIKTRPGQLVAAKTERDTQELTLGALPETTKVQ